MASRSERQCETRQPRIEPPSVAAAKKRGGYDCEFIERPQKAFQTDCPVCLLVLCEPYQVTCCGYSFCRTCIEPIQTDKKSCPTCNQTDFAVYPNKGLQRALNEFRVRCPHNGEGCEWTGELGELEKHLNESPGVNKQLVGCDLVEVGCSHCGKPFQRRHVAAHQIESCPRRPFSCDYCGEYESNCEDVTANHWPVCKSRPVPCPNECGLYPKRQHLDHHVDKECPLTIANCNFHYAGCEVRLPRKEMPNHLAENLILHTSLLAAHSQKMVKELQQNRQKIGDLEKENAALKESLQKSNKEIFELRESVQSYTSIAPVKLVMHNFEQHQRNDDVWYSEPFYTHPHGYKMCLAVHANGCGDGKGTHISVYVYLMQGDFDEWLKWPFEAEVIVRLLSQTDGVEHYESKIYINSIEGPSTISRVISGERAKRGSGHSKFVPHSELYRKKYLVDNCLSFRINVYSKDRMLELEEALESHICVLPITFTMRNFESYKRCDRSWASPSFYTRPQGYRMCIRVFASGFGSGKDTHLSVHARVVRGEFDNYLRWPFQGDITIQLLNQLYDKNHHEYTINFTLADGANHYATDRVTLGERAPYSYGLSKFILHHELNHNPAKNCQYLKYDCLCFRVTKVKLRN